MPTHARHLHTITSIHRVMRYVHHLGVRVNDLEPLLYYDAAMDITDRGDGFGVTYECDRGCRFYKNSQPGPCRLMSCGGTVRARYWTRAERPPGEGPDQPPIFDRFGAGLVTWQSMSSEQRLAWWDLQEDVDRRGTTDDRA